jgi:hypothetical protein
MPDALFPGDFAPLVRLPGRTHLPHGYKLNAGGTTFMAHIDLTFKAHPLGFNDTQVAAGMVLARTNEHIGREPPEELSEIVEDMYEASFPDDFLPLARVPGSTYLHYGHMRLASGHFLVGKSLHD